LFAYTLLLLSSSSTAFRSFDKQPTHLLSDTINMPASSTPKAKTATKKTEASHPTYRDMISDAISTLKERNGSSRQALKKYIQSNFKELKNFDSQFNNALRRGVERGEFTQPKGPSGPVKLNKKKETEKKPKAATKETVVEKPKKPVAKPKKATVEKEVKPKETKSKKPVATKSAAPKKAPKEKVEKAPKPKASPPKKVKKAAPAPAVAEKPAVLTKTKSGRVSKSTAAPKATKKMTPRKKGAAKKSYSTAAASAAEE